MILIVGLGNPGEKYINTWHNLGFLAVDKFKEINNFPDFKASKKFDSFFSEGFMGKEKIILLKPQTFMNNSGKAVKSAIDFYKIKSENILVIHDDIDIKFGKIKIVNNRGTAGHKGVESIVNELKTKDFTRVRIGIQPKSEKPKNTEVFVLKKIDKEEEKELEEIIKKAVKETKSTIEKIK